MRPTTLTVVLKAALHPIARMWPAVGIAWSANLLGGAAKASWAAHVDGFLKCMVSRPSILLTV